MGDVMDEVNAIAQCKDCPWYKTCVSPMKFTPEDIKRQIEASGSMMGAGSSDANMQGLLASMASAAQNTMLEACPIFIQRLRSSPKLMEHLKRAMQDWGESLDT
jgi:hypothetical protein